MKIAVNTRFLLPNEMEGIGRFSYEVIRRLVEQHPEDEFIFFFDRPYAEEFIFGQNVTPVVIGPPARHPILWYIWFEWSIPQALKRYQPDVFFSPDGYLSMRTDVKTVLVMHDVVYLHFPNDLPWMVRQYYRYFVPRFLKQAQTVVTVSEFVKNDLIQHFQLPEEKVWVANNACEHGFSPLGQEEKEKIKTQYSGGAPYFLYAGSIHPRKNVDSLILAFDRFKSREKTPVKLLLAGRLAWKSRKVKKAYEGAKCKEDIQFLGYVPAVDLPKLMGSALAFVYISKHEGFGIPLLEAMHSEVPLISANTSSLPEVAGDAALLVDPAEIDDISVALAQVYKEKALRRRLVLKGKTQRARFSWNRSAAILYEVLKKAALYK